MILASSLIALSSSLILFPHVSGAVKPLGPNVLDDPVFTKLGPYSPYLAQGSGVAAGQERCQVVQVNILQRHGARYPTSGANKVIQSALLKLANVSHITDPSLQFIQHYRFSPSKSEVDNLTDFGRRQSYDAGVDMAETYTGFAQRPFFRAASEARVVESAGFFQLGFEGRPFDLNATLPLPDVVIIEADTSNNTLDVSSCLAAETMDPDPGDVAEQDWLSTYAPPIAARLNAALPGANLTTTDINSLMSLCGFDSLKTLSPTKSPWCDAFTPEEWEANEYYFDVSKFYGHAYGNPYSITQGASYVNELVARLTSNSTVVQAGSTNTSLPLGIVPVGTKRVYVDFSHDNNMAQILAALGLLKDPKLLPTKPSTAIIEPHAFVVSSIVPFSGRFTFERLACSSRTSTIRSDHHTQPSSASASAAAAAGGGRHPHQDPAMISGQPPKEDEKEDFIRISINGAIQSTFSNSSSSSSFTHDHYPNGLIPLKDWLASGPVQFAQAGGDWASVCN